MGWGGHDSYVYTARSATRADKRVEEVYTKSHLDPKMNPKGVLFRESCDSDEHPESNAALFFLDVTGSMDRVLMSTAQGQLGKLMDILVHSAVIPHPQWLVGACGDAQNNRNGRGEEAPLQVGQFESDIRIDDDLQRIYFERAGGGNGGETYLLPIYWAARHTRIDCYLKRRNKGYLFTIGDEPFHPFVTREEVQRVIGDTLERDLSAAEVLAMAREMYHVFHVNIREGDCGRDSKTISAWRSLLGPNLLDLEDHTAICETMAAAIALRQGVVHPQRLDTDLPKIGVSKKQLVVVKQAIGPLALSLTGGNDNDTPNDDSGTHHF